MRFLIIGTNFISDLFVDALARLRSYGVDVSASAVFSRKQETGGAFMGKNALSGEIVCDLESAFDLYRRGRFDAVYVASPNMCHEEQSVFFLERGVSVLCEKPAALSPESLERIGEAAKKGGAVFMEAMRPTHDTAVQKIRLAVDRITPVRSVRFEFSQYSSRYDRFLSGEAVNTFDPVMGNSALRDLGVYTIAAAQALFGDPVVDGAAAARLANGFEASGAAVFSYPGFVCTASWSKVCRQTAPSAILGERGSITIDRLSEPRDVRLYSAGGDCEAIVPDAAENNMVFEIADFVSALGGEDRSVRFGGGSMKDAKACFDDSIRRAYIIEKILLAQR